MRHVQRALTAQLAVDVVFVDEAEHQRGCSAQHAVELAADLGAETGLDIIRRDPQAGVHQTYVAPRTAVAGAMSFEYGDAFTLFEQVNGRRQTGDAGADHAHIHLEFAIECGTVGAAGGEVFPQTCFA